MLCFAARKAKPDYSAMSHLRIEICPPRRHRRTDMVRIWMSAQKLCDELRTTSRLQHLSFVFFEENTVIWSIDSQPRDTFRSLFESHIEILMGVFYRLFNVAKVEIHLPRGLFRNKYLQNLRRLNEEHMTCLTHHRLEEWENKLNHISRCMDLF